MSLIPQAGVKSFSSGNENSTIVFTIKDLHDNQWIAKGDIGERVMYAGIAAGVPFEEACGGNAECCTCHVYAPIDQIIEKERDFPNATADELYKEPEAQELDALDFA